jgi:uncharacterized protein (TIGR04562 family)
MNKPEFLHKYKLNWDTFDVIIGGKSPLDVNSYLATINGRDGVYNFLSGYGFDMADPIQKAELFGNFQEAVQFIRRYFLKEGNPEGLDLKVPGLLFTITDTADLFLIASGNYAQQKVTVEEAMWAGIILKVMHTILHTDKDLRYRYFSTIQLQIFDRYYRYLNREGNDLFLKNENGDEKIPLFDFQTKAKKTRDSIIIKLLHKKENVAEELFDRIGLRFVTYNRFDVLRTIRFMYNNYLVMAHNTKPSRAINTLFDMQQFKHDYYELVKQCLREEWTEEQFEIEIEKLSRNVLPIHPLEHNLHTSKDYHAIHFTCRQLIKYRNPFTEQFSKLRQAAKEAGHQNDLAKKILELDTSSIATDVRFFYPYEIQITDLESHKKNTEGEASHQDYKKSQLKSAMKRIFRLLIEHKNITV